MSTLLRPPRMAPHSRPTMRRGAASPAEAAGPAVQASQPGRLIDPAIAAVPWAFRSYMRFAPLLWAAGALYLWAAVMLVTLARRRWPRGAGVNCVIASWLGIALTQAISAMLNGILVGDIGMGLRAALSFRVTGWVFAALALAAGAGWQLGNRAAAHWVARLGLHTFVLGAIGLGAGLAGAGEMHFPTPISALLPDSEMVKGYASVAFFRYEETLGEKATRLILFYPWAPALGTGSLVIGLISTRVADWRWRCAGMAGGLLGVIFSWSRLAIAAAAFIAGLLIFIRMPRWLKVVSVTAAVLTVWGLYVADIDLLSNFLDMRAAADRARSGSSQARDLIYEKSWEGFLQSPLIGWGWGGDSVHRIESLPIGSHSTFYGLLYTGGVLTFGAFAVAMATTLVAIVVRLCRAPSGEARHDATIALCLWIALVFTAPFEALYSLTLPCLALFAWIGGVISGGAPPAESSGRDGPAPAVRP